MAQILQGLPCIRHFVSSCSPDRAPGSPPVFCKAWGPWRGSWLPLPRCPLGQCQGMAFWLLNHFENAVISNWCLALAVFSICIGLFPWSEVSGLFITANMFHHTLQSPNVLPVWGFLSITLISCMPLMLNYKFFPLHPLKTGACPLQMDFKGWPVE